MESDYSSDCNIFEPQITNQTPTPLCNPSQVSISNDSGQQNNTEPKKRNRSLYSLRKQQLEIEKDRVQAIRDIKESVDESNKIQENTNKLLEILIQQQANRN